MYKFVKNEVLSLPKLETRSHSSLDGTLSNYQNKLSEKFLCIIGQLQLQINTISKQNIFNLENRMKHFITKRDKFFNDQYQIIESISSTDEQFESLRNKLIIIKGKILDEFDSFKQDSLQIYGNSYQQITKSIEESIQSSKDIIHMIHPATSERLKNEVLKINTDYLNTKKDLIKSIYLIKNDILHQQESVINEFEKKKESWNSNQFVVLIERVKNKLYPLVPINYESLYKRFYTDQEKFSNCFKKAVADVSLIVPPAQFSYESISKWWCNVETLLECFDNFIKQFSNQFQAKLNQNIEENNQLISDLEKELFKLVNNMNNKEDDQKARLAIDELTFLSNTSEQINKQFYDKIQNYFNYRRDCLKKCFESIHNFYQKMIDSHQQYISQLSERETIEINEKEQLKSNSKSKIDKLEAEFLESKGKISILISEKEIDSETKHCKQILSQIEQEERNYFTNMSNIFEQQPSKVIQIFEQSEKVILEYLRVKKIIESKTSTNKQKQTRNNRSQSRQKGGRLKQPVPESFTIDCGLIFESTEELTVIPTFNDFFDSPNFQSSVEKVVSKSDKNEKGRRTSVGRKSSSSNLNSKSSSKGKSASKSGNQSKLSFLGIEFNEAMIPNFELNDVIPKIDDKISIWICLPTTDDLNDFFTQFKIVYLNNFYSIYEENLKKAKNEENKEKLTFELNEKLRVLHPRYSSIEVNIAEARKIKIESQKDQLELHFRRISMQFNSLVSKFKQKSDNNEEDVINEVEKLRGYIHDLNNQKNGRALTFHGENFKISDKLCQLKIENFFNSQEKSIDDFFNFFRAKNDRFKEACLNKNVINSEEEKKMALGYFESMDKQMNDIQKAFKTNFQSTTKRIENLHKEIFNSFENSFQFHQFDVKFIDENFSIQTEFNRKYDSLVSQNFHQEKEIQKILDEIDLMINKNVTFEDHQNKINTILNCLENLRAKIVNRSFFLKQLKSDIIIDTFAYKIDLNDNKDVKEMLPQKNELSEKPISKKSSTKLKSSKSKSSAKNQPKKEEHKNQIKTSGQVICFSKMLEDLKLDFTSRLTKISQNYYSQYKTRKFENTRPDEIPPTQNDFLAKINEFWLNLTKSNDSILLESILKFRHQVSNALTKSKELEKLMFEIFVDFYITKNEKEMNSFQNEIDIEKNGFDKEKEKNRSFLDMKISDENNNEILEKIIEEEEKRSQKEREFLTKIKSQLFEYEKNCIQFYISKLNFLTALSLSLFDKFVLIEDLVDGPTVENQRKTMKEMMKNKIRFSTFNSNISKRPFAIRSWQKVIQYTAQNEENCEDLKDHEISEEKVKSKGEISEQNSKEALRPDSTKHSARKLKEAKNKKDKNSENEGDVKSFDTPIHRKVIIERNRAFSIFDEEIKQRAKKFNDFVNSMEKNEDDFNDYWKKVISTLRPDYCLPKLEYAPNI